VLTGESAQSPEPPADGARVNHRMVGSHRTIVGALPEASASSECQGWPAPNVRSRSGTDWFRWTRPRKKWRSGMKLFRGSDTNPSDLRETARLIRAVVARRGKKERP
jgi:hypothetical protein